MSVLIPLSSDGDVTHSCAWVCQLTGAIGKLAAVIREIIPTTTANIVYILTITDRDQNVHDCPRDIVAGSVR